MDVDIIRDSVRGTKKLPNIMLDSFTEGVNKAGDNARKSSSKWSDANVAVIFGGAKSDAGDGRRFMIDQHSENGKQILCLDGGLLRGYTDHLDELTYHYRVGLGFPTAMGEFRNFGSPNDRWKAYSKKFNVELKPWRDSNNKDKHIVVCTQADAWSMDNLDSVEFSKEWIREIRKHTDRPILVRPHHSIDFQLGRNPHHKYDNLMRGDTEKIKRYFYNEQAKFDVKYDYSEFKDVTLSEDFSQGLSIFKDIENAWAVISWNSTVCTDAIVSGLPVFMMAPERTFAYDLNNKDLSQIENPMLHDRTQWINDICYTMYSLDEYKEGIPWKKFKAYF